MHGLRRTLWYLFLFQFFFVIATPEAHAYLDPGTGSYILQFLLAAFLGAFFVMKGYWRRVRSYISSFFSRKNKADD